MRRGGARGKHLPGLPATSARVRALLLALYPAPLWNGDTPPVGALAQLGRVVGAPQWRISDAWTARRHVAEEVIAEWERVVETRS